MRRGFHEPKEKPRRFYETVTVEPSPEGFRVLLDRRGARTPGGSPLALPTEPLARQVAEEWAGQGEVLEMADMHATRLANTAIDAIPGARDATADTVAQYAGSDLTCYFAEAPAALAQRQAEGWGPLLDRAEQELGLSFVRICGIIHQPQLPETLARVRDFALALDDFQLAGLAFAVSLYGSAVLAVAVQGGWLSASEAFELSRLDEAWQEEQWGIDEEAAQRTARLRQEAQMLDAWFANLSRPFPVQMESSEPDKKGLSSKA